MRTIIKTDKRLGLERWAAYVLTDKRSLILVGFFHGERGARTAALQFINKYETK